MVCLAPWDDHVAQLHPVWSQKNPLLPPPGEEKLF